MKLLHVLVILTVNQIPCNTNGHVIPFMWFELNELTFNFLKFLKLDGFVTFNFNHTKGIVWSCIAWVLNPCFVLWFVWFLVNTYVNFDGFLSKWEYLQGEMLGMLGERGKNNNNK